MKENKTYLLVIILLQQNRIISLNIIIKTDDNKNKKL